MDASVKHLWLWLKFQSFLQKQILLWNKEYLVIIDVKE